MNETERYYKCKSCGQIEPSGIWKHSINKSNACAHCNSIGRESTWPDKATLEMLAFIQQYDQSATEYGQVATVFLSSVLELLFEELLYTMAYLDLSYDDASFLVDALIDAYRGRSRMFALYKGIGYGSFRKHLDEIGVSDFADHWDSIVEYRNKVVHGRYDQLPEISPNLINTIISESLQVFSRLNNHYNEESFKFRSMADRNVKANEDLDKLKKWINSVYPDEEDRKVGDQAPGPGRGARLGPGGPLFGWDYVKVQSAQRLWRQGAGVTSERLIRRTLRRAGAAENF